MARVIFLLTVQARVIFLLTVQARVIFLLTEEKIFQKSTNQKQELPVVAIFVNRSGQIEQSLQRTFHRCFLPSFGSFSQAVSEEKIFLNRPIRNKNCLWWPCLLMDRDKMCNLERGPSIDASYQVSVHLAEGFQRRRLKCEKLMDDRRRTPSDGKSSYCLWQGELKNHSFRLQLMEQLQRPPVLKDHILLTEQMVSYNYDMLKLFHYNIIITFYKYYIVWSFN